MSTKSHLPYPRRYESHQSWMSRCDEWERNRHRNQSGGLSGHPNKHGYKEVYDNEVYVIDEADEVLVGNVKLGDRLKVVRHGYGSQYANMTRTFARQNGLGFVLVKLGCGMTARYDGIAYDISEKQISGETTAETFAILQDPSIPTNWGIVWETSGTEGGYTSERAARTAALAQGGSEGDGEETKTWNW